MAFDAQDPKWTAYVLGELDDDARAAIDAELAGSPEAQRYVEDLRRTINLLSAELTAEPCPVPADASLESGELEPAAIDELSVDGLPEPPAELFHTVRPEGHSRSFGRLAFLALAASLLAVVGLGSFLLSGGGQIRQAILAMRHRGTPAQNAAYVKAEEEGELDDSVASVAPALPNGEKSFPQSAQELTKDELTDGMPPVTLKGHGRRRTESLEMAVTPKIIIQEDSEESVNDHAPASHADPVAKKKPRKDINYAVSKPTYETKSADRTRPTPSVPDSSSSEIRVRVPTPAEMAKGPTFDFAVPVLKQEDGRQIINFSMGVSRGESPNRSGGETYEPITDNPFLAVGENPLSTFSIDVDTGSYSIVRRYLQQNHQLPPPSAVRIEELVNYFHYDYPQPEDGKPFAANVEVAGCPWNGEHRLVRVGIKGREVSRDHRPLTNLVFLVDVSGSMQSPDKLPLVKESLRMLAEQMGENDRVAIVVYAGTSGLVLPSTTGINRQEIIRSIDALEAGGSTNGAQGIQLAYEVAVANFIKGGVNRVILATDGDFNVGTTDRGDLVRLITEKAASGVFLTTLGYGMGNLKDATLEQLADKGNGNYAYIDNVREAKKVLVEQMSGTLVTIAKDVKIQIEFNPLQVAAFRLIGYENRILRHEDFNNDKKDAGEIGAGHTVTALYELVPAGKQPAGAGAEGQAGAAAVDPLKYQQKTALTPASDTGELLTLKLRYKQPDGDKSELLEYPVKDAGHAYGRATGDFKFAASVALFGMLLRDSPYKGTASFDAAVELAQEGRGSDPEGYRSELIELINAARTLKRGHQGGEGGEIRE